MAEQQKIMKSLPSDGWNRAVASGSDTDSFWLDPAGDLSFVASGGWDEVVLPEGVECKIALIQVHTGTTDFTQADSPDMFYHSSNSDGTGWTWHVGAFTMSIGKAEGSIGYVMAQPGKKIAVKVLS